MGEVAGHPRAQRGRLPERVHGEVERGDAVRGAAALARAEPLLRGAEERGERGDGDGGQREKA